jgi:hypothetical protein
MAYGDGVCVVDALSPDECSHGKQEQDPEAWIDVKMLIGEFASVS